MTENVSALNDPTSKNAQTSREEVAAFLRDKPDRCFCYVALPIPSLPLVRRPVITTWTGDVLGYIVERRPAVRDNFGGTRQWIRAHAINGRVYAGWYFASSGNYARLRSVKA